MSATEALYRYLAIKDTANRIRRLIDHNQSEERDIYGELIGKAYPPEIVAHFVDAVAALHKAHVYACHIDYLVSGLEDEEEFLRRVRADLAALPTGKDGSP